MSIDYYGIASCANQLRDSMGVRKGVTDIFRLLEENGYQSFRYPLGEDSILGASANYGKDKVIITNSSMILAREIFTAAHELGHHQLHLQRNGETIVDFTGEHFDSCEEEANYFAACFLMPKHVMQRYVEETLMKPEGELLSGMDVAMIQSVFNVSFESALNRLQTIKAITEENRKDLEKEKEQKSVRAFVRAINGNLLLMEKSEKKHIPHELLRMAIDNHGRKMVPSDSLKKIFQAFDITLQIEDEEDAYDKQGESEEGRKKKRVVHESDT